MDAQFTPKHQGLLPPFYAVVMGFTLLFFGLLFVCDATHDYP